MTESARACAQSDNPHPSPEPFILKLGDLALQACDDADALNEVMRAYSALEKLIDTNAAYDSEDLAPSRTELSALLRLLNEALTSRVGIVNAAAGALRTALQSPPATLG